MRKLDVCLTAVLTLAGCSIVSPRPQADERPVEIFTSGAPKRPFAKVSKLDLYVEKWGRGEPSVDDFRPELTREARLSGADAVVDLEWTLKGTPDNGVYHVKGTGVAYLAHAGERAPGEVAPGDVEVLSGAPERPYAKVSSLDLYVEKKAGGKPSLEEVLPELKRQARLSGAEAVIDVQWTLRGTKDAGVYHVTATGIAYSEPAASPAPADAGPR
jgi:uncharacterized protein YbjQ (UPF0145 family)